MQARYSVGLGWCAAALALACSSSDAPSSLENGAGSNAGGSAGRSGSSSAGASASNGGASGSGVSMNGGAANAGTGPSAGGTMNAQAGAGGTAPASGGAPAGGAANGGAGASAGAGGGTPPLSSCPAPPAGAPDNAIKALNAINTIRLAMGVECATLQLTLDKSAQAHCDFYAANTGNTMCESDSISPHSEVAGCTGFTGADPGARIKAAGYSGNGWSEVMAFNNDPNKAVTQWVNSVWHRTPLLSPWWDDMGYGNAAKCDVIDQGPGKQMPATTSAMYPYAGQTGVARSFNGAQEGPTPPAPPMGWPSGLPVTLYVKQATTVSHSIEVMGSGTPLAHQFIDYKQSNNDSSQLILYADKPLSANTTYHVTIAVTISGTPKTFDWTFTTGS